MIRSPKKVGSSGFQVGVSHVLGLGVPGIPGSPKYGEKWPSIGVGPDFTYFWGFYGRNCEPVPTRDPARAPVERGVL